MTYKYRVSKMSLKLMDSCENLVRNKKSYVTVELQFKKKRKEGNR